MVKKDTKVKIDWKGLVPTFVEFAERRLKLRGSPPTLRGLFYALTTRNVIPNTKKVYKSLSRILVKAREDGTFSWDLLKDKTRSVVNGNGHGWTIEELKEEPDEIVARRMSSVLYDLEKLVTDTAVHYSLERWDRQPKKVYILLEKEALVDDIKSFIGNLGVSILVCKGYTSATALKDLATQIREEGREVVLLHIGDFDPSGVDIQRYMEDKLKNYHGLNVSVQRLMVSLDQIEGHELPTRPEDSDEREKIKRDPRYKTWTHGMFRVEVDAMVEIVPDVSRRIIRKAINSHFDRDIYRENKATRDQIQEECERRVVDVSEEFRPLYERARELVGDRDTDEEE